MLLIMIELTDAERKCDRPEIEGAWEELVKRLSNTKSK